MNEKRFAMNLRPASWKVYDKLLVKHKILWSEIEESFKNDKLKIRKVGKDKYNQLRYSAMSRTSAGRYLIIYFIEEKDTIKIISARDQASKEKKKFKGGIL